MKPERKSQSRPAAAQVISLVAYREAHRSPLQESAAAPVGAGAVSVMDAYCRWLALVSAAWTFWW
jgi:hypothetical protein